MEGTKAKARALIKEIIGPFQTFHSTSDLPGGSTQNKSRHNKEVNATKCNMDKRWKLKEMFGVIEPIPRFVIVEWEGTYKPNLIYNVNRSRQFNIGRPATPRPRLAICVALHRHDDIHMPTQPHTTLRPLVKMELGGDGSPNSLLRADRPILLKCSRPVDRGLVRTRALVDLKCAFVTGGETALESPGLVGCLGR